MEIIGHEKQMDFFSRTFLNERLAHAYIFAGPSGIGKKLVALYLAQLVNCMALKGMMPCDECLACRKIKDLKHSEVLVFKTMTKSIKIEDIRNLQKKTHLKRTESKYGFIIVDDSDKMTIEASNAFLKTLEEPPNNFIIILLTTNLTKFPKTIISRSQVIKFSELKDKDKVKIIKNNLNVDELKIEQALELSGGKIRDAVLLLQDCDSDYFVSINNLALSYLKEEVSVNTHKEILSLVRDKIKFDKFLNMLIAHESKNYKINYNSKKISDLMNMKKMLNRNVNPNLLATKLLCK